MDQPPNADQEREYRCRYCDKAFSSTQALGGHQNAHKVQRAMEKAAREMEGNNHFGYYGPRAAAYPGPYLVDRWRVGYNAGPWMPLAGNPYPMARPGSFDLYSRWAAAPPVQRSFGQSHGLNLRFSGNGAGPSGSGSGSRPVYPDLRAFAGPRAGPGGNPGGRDDKQKEDDSGLDLTLKL